MLPRTDASACRPSRRLLSLSRALLSLRARIGKRSQVATVRVFAPTDGWCLLVVPATGWYEAIGAWAMLPFGVVAVLQPARSPAPSLLRQLYCRVVNGLGARGDGEENGMALGTTRRKKYKRKNSFHPQNISAEFVL